MDEGDERGSARLGVTNTLATTSLGRAEARRTGIAGHQDPGWTRGYDGCDPMLDQRRYFLHQQAAIVVDGGQVRIG